MKHVSRIALVLGLALASWSAASAGPIDECAVMAEGGAELRQCLDTQLQISDQAMSEALGLARTAAQRVDQAAGGSAAVLGVEASQQAWEAFRDANCQLREFLTSDGEAYATACRIQMTRARTDELRELAAHAPR